MHTQQTHTHTLKRMLSPGLYSRGRYNSHSIRKLLYEQATTEHMQTVKKTQVQRHVERLSDAQADMLRATTGRQTDSCQPDRQMHRGRVLTSNQYTRLLFTLTYFCRIHLSVPTCIAGRVRLLIEAHPSCV